MGNLEKQVPPRHASFSLMLICMLASDWTALGLGVESQGFLFLTFEVNTWFLFHSPKVATTGHRGRSHAETWNKITICHNPSKSRPPAVSRPSAEQDWRGTTPTLDTW